LENKKGHREKYPDTFPKYRKTDRHSMIKNGWRKTPLKCKAETLKSRKGQELNSLMPPTPLVSDKKKKKHRRRRKRGGKTASCREYLQKHVE